MDDCALTWSWPCQGALLGLAGSLLGIRRTHGGVHARRCEGLPPERAKCTPRSARRCSNSVARGPGAAVGGVDPARARAPGLPNMGVWARRATLRGALACGVVVATVTPVTDFGLRAGTRDHLDPSVATAASPWLDRFWQERRASFGVSPPRGGRSLAPPKRSGAVARWPFSSTQVPERRSAVTEFRSWAARVATRRPPCWRRTEPWSSRSGIVRPMAGMRWKSPSFSVRRVDSSRRWVDDATRALNVALERSTS